MIQRGPFLRPVVPVPPPPGLECGHEPIPFSFIAGEVLCGRMETSGTHASFEELDVRQTRIGELVLRRRRPLCMPDTWVYEVKLDERFLMSSLMHESEEALVRLPLRRLEGDGWRVLVGGLGLGYTAAAALEWQEVEVLEVVELLPEVIEWHRSNLVPLAEMLRESDRCQVVQGNCFEQIRDAATATYDAVLIDIDDSPEHLLSPDHGSFYAVAGLENVRRILTPGGVFGLWTAGACLPGFLERLGRVFPRADAEPVRFTNPLFEREDVNTVYVAQGRAGLSPS
jgi:spermidine synthase